MLASKPAPSLEYLNSVFEYKDGDLYNKASRNSRALAGALAGSRTSLYASVCIEGQVYGIHRIIFLMHHGYMPDAIDHINGDKMDNRIENLRPATNSQNQHNQAVRASNKSGVKGVSWVQKYSKWYACIRINGKNKNLGMFDKLESAKEFIELVREMHHGNFTNHGTFKENIS
jgi:hypothetical protein